MIEIKLHRVYRGAPTSVILEGGRSLKETIVYIEKELAVSHWSSILYKESIKPDYVILINGKSNRDLSTTLREGDTVSISVLMGGG
jgi:hypothetical protein